MIVTEGQVSDISCVHELVEHLRWPTEWNALIAHRDAIRTRPYDDDAEQALIIWLEEHRARLQSAREALLRQCEAVSDCRPKRRRTDLAVSRR